MKLKKDRRNYRVHDEKSKKIIGQSLDQCGAGRSILADSTGEIIAGNGVFEQAEARGIKTRMIETDGTELIVVVRKDLKPGDDKRKLLALADNAASDASSWNAELVRQDWGRQTGEQWGINNQIWETKPSCFTPERSEETKIGLDNIDDFDDSGLPPELQNVEIEPSELPKIEGDFKTEYGRVIITFPWDRQADVERLLGIPRLDKILYSIEDILG